MVVIQMGSVCKKSLSFTHGMYKFLYVCYTTVISKEETTEREKEEEEESIRASI